jgi:hypothetical protein
MSEALRYRPNSPPIIQETIDQETIMVNLDTGSYYSLNPVGTYVWRALDAGADVDDIAASVTGLFSIDAATAEPDVRAFVQRLVDEELVVQRQDEPGSWVDDAPGEAPGAYEAPRVDHYTDMQELLLLDPVHEVDASGWPSRP